MSINDAYYNNRNVDYNGNNLTVDVGTFTVNGDLSVTGSIIGTEDSSVDLNTNTTLYITGNDDWYFDNDDKNFFIFNDQYKKISMGYDVENVSMIYSATQRDNPMFCFSGETDWNNYGSGTGNRYLARFQNYANTSGSSGLDIVLNRTDNDITNANIFLNFSGFTGSTFDNSGYIAGLYNDEGLGIYSGNNIRIDAGNDLILHGGTISADSETINIETSSDSSGNNVNIVSTKTGSGPQSIVSIEASRVTNDDTFIEFKASGNQIGFIRSVKPWVDNNPSRGAFFGYDENGNADYAEGEDPSGLFAGPNGGVQYISFGADFGEIFKFADHSEWQLDNDLDLPEGTIVYVLEDKFYKNPEKGMIPMVVTKRSAFIGNHFNSAHKSECLSIIGQVPVFVEGLCSHGDYLIPKGNLCVAVSPKDISFEEYKDAIGISLGSKEFEKVSRVNCLVGKK